MSVNCTLCGQSMAVAERPSKKGSVAPNPYHEQCSQLQYELDTAENSPMPRQAEMVQKRIDNLIRKRAGQVTAFP